MYMGFVIASRQLLPGAEPLIALWRQAVDPGVRLEEVFGIVGAWLTTHHEFLFAILCLGPLIWGSALLFNDVQDLEADKHNPRRSKSPLVRALVTPRQAIWGAVGLAATGLLLAALIHAVFFAIMAACLFLSWAYSAPPLRLKGRAGFDVLVNVLGVGVLCTLAGWSLARPVTDFPWPYLVQPILLLAAAYVPTTMVDLPYDAEYGFHTISVKLGIQRAFWLGFGLNAGAALLYLVTAWANYIVTWRVFEVTWPFVAAEILLYGLFYPRRGALSFQRSVAAILLTATPFAIGQAIFIADYVGYLRL